MVDHFITDIEIKNFKCFDNFEMNDFAQVNLIGGKNNVGKTALLEACYVNVHAQDVKSFVMALQNIKFTRENINMLLGSTKYDVKKFLEQTSGICLKSNVNRCAYNIEEKNGAKKYILEFKEECVDVNVNKFSFEKTAIDAINYIDNFGLSNTEIIKKYSSIQKKDQESYLNRILVALDQRIEAFKIIEEKPQCKIDGKYLEITELGDGVRHLISIVTSIYASENSYLFIDEIDNGIHYTVLDKIWEAILSLSKKLNVQIFATTHSKECIESYGRAAKNLKNKNICFTTLVRNKSDKIVAMNYDYKLFLSTLEQNHEVRGW